MTRLSFLRRLRIGLHYALNPGGVTHKSRLSRARAEALKAETTARLRREVAEREREALQAATVERVAYMAVAEALR